MKKAGISSASIRNKIKDSAWRKRKAEILRNWRAKNRAHYIEWRRNYEQKNREKIRLQKKGSYGRLPKEKKELYKNNRLHPEKVDRDRNARRRRQQENKDAVNARQREYYQRNPDKTKKWTTSKRESRMIRCRVLYYIDPVYRLKKLTRDRILCAIKRKGFTKSGRAKDLIGCSWETLKAHIESLFKEGMSWKNQGEWHIDHIVPMAKFNLLDPVSLKSCCHYTNLQPLWGQDNIKKGARVDWKR